MVRSFKRQKNQQRELTKYLEKMIYALAIAWAVCKSKWTWFCLKGGTVWSFYWKQENRFSIDIDIISKTDRKDSNAFCKRLLTLPISLTGCWLGGPPPETNFPPGKKSPYNWPEYPKHIISSNAILNKQGSGTILLDILMRGFDLSEMWFWNACNN